MINLYFQDFIVSKYKATGSFYEGLASVKNQDGLYGFINKDGEEVIPCQYQEVRNFFEGLVAVKKQDGLWGFINKESKEIIKCEYQETGDFTETLGLAPVKTDHNTWIYIDKNGRQAIDITFAEAYNFSEGYAIVEVFYSKGEYYLDKFGNLYGPYNMVINFINGTALVKDDDENVCIINKSFEIIDKKSLDSVKYVSSIFNDYFKVKDINGKIGYLDRHFNEIIPSIYSDGRNFSDGLAVIEISTEFIGFVTPEGKITAFTKNQYVEINNFNEGLARVKNPQGLYGYINKSGKEVIKCQYQDADDFSEGLAGVIDTDGVYHYIDKKGIKKITIASTYNSVIELEDKTIYISEENQDKLDETKLKVLNLIKKEILDQVESCIDNIAYDTTSGLYQQPKTKTKKKSKTTNKPI